MNDLRLYNVEDDIDRESSGRSGVCCIINLEHFLGSDKTNEK